MIKILRIAKREFLTTVKTKGFIIMLIVFPILFSGGGISYALLKDRVDTEDKNIAIVDRSGEVADFLIETVQKRNNEVVFDKEKDKKVKPAYVISVEEPNTKDPQAQRLELSNRVRDGSLHSFIDIGKDAVNGGEDQETNRVHYHSKSAALDNFRNWIVYPLNGYVRTLRFSRAGVEESVVEGLLTWVNVEPMGLLSIDEDTGSVSDAEKSSEAEAVLMPMIMGMLLYMMILMGSLPLLSSVMEEKTQRIAEVMLGSVKPFEFMMGKLLGGVAVSLTGAAVYVLGGTLTVKFLGVADKVPFEVVPWFFAFLAGAIFMYGSIYSALGASCNDPKDVQSMTIPAMLPIIVAMFLMFPIIENSQTTFATVASLIPFFTPMLMVVRIASPYGAPLYQQWLGLFGVVSFAILFVWIGGRIFRVGILMAGAPKFKNLIKWAIKG
ncbi:MAG: ABC transporter permease [Calditrichaeota bacterium]|nr:ABC transporter permease [Calditrichota bacterium]